MAEVVHELTPAQDAAMLKALESGCVCSVRYGERTIHAAYCRRRVDRG